MDLELIRRFKIQNKEGVITFLPNVKLPEFKRPDINCLGLTYWVEILLYLLEIKKNLKAGVCFRELN